MAWENKIPSVKLVLGRNLFNKLLGVLEFNENLKIEDENFSEVAQKIKNKILTYSVPREKDEDGIEYVDIRFYTKEASDLIWQLLQFAKFKNSSIIAQNNQFLLYTYYSYNKGWCFNYVKEKQ